MNELWYLIDARPGQWIGDVIGSTLRAQQGNRNITGFVFNNVVVRCSDEDTVQTLLQKYDEGLKENK